ncbi:P-loop containing nucleoside triphosphate hydrolase protein [Cylindrobasidium torrendii FP15055 ss-10]|uniref:p-loop containing nucleoside triphosphate hydrolase protein n=1 Tax=Cylindrobasidium torrendii FP15055 ss-10 TaxID=1314674 RepID=A0A0D7BIK6_9AGAR|nr:P-loop containing nucleoside triphosphate hydrolase protein [Cylindrobasidium torrendii FP15055 ss-10]
MEHAYPLFPQPLLARFDATTKPLLLTYAPPESLPEDSLVPETYAKHWNTLIAWELDQLAIDKQAVVLWKVAIAIVDWNASIFSVPVPGIRENHPYLEPGDLLHFREVDVKGKRGTGRASEGRITSIIKREGLVNFVCPALKDHIQFYVPHVHGNPLDARGFPTFTPKDSIPLHFNVSFVTSSAPTLAMHTAINAAANVLRINRVTAQRWLFPNPQHVSAVDTTAKRLPEEWFDSGLNEEQKRAVAFASTYQFPVPYIIKGPPGTGKTRTVVELVHQILAGNPNAHILVCAPSNSATDTLALRLAKRLSRDQLLRLNDPKRTFAEVPGVLLPYCHIDSNHFALPDIDVLLNYRVLVTSCLDASLLMKARCTNTCFGILEDITLGAIHPTRQRPIQPHWTHLIVDEAAQGSEPELLIPLTVAMPFAPPDGRNVTSVGVDVPQLVLCGDPNQLGPMITSEKARVYELNVSLLERLLERPMYARFTKNGGRDVPPGLPIPFIQLNYRSHPTILMPPSAMFYDDTLQPCATVNGHVAWSGLPNPKVPFMFLGSDSEDDCIEERATWFNSGEIEHVVKTIKGLLEAFTSDPPVQAKEIGVMAPWREQVWRLRERLRAENLGMVDVGTVEDYQGREMRVIILSCVRSRTRFLEEDEKLGMGLVHERKRMNVAITRAREMLIVIGNGDVLKLDPYWRSFLQFVIRNKLYRGPELKLEMDGNYISRLESKLMSLYNEGAVDAEHEGILLAGGMAREILREGAD